MSDDGSFTLFLMWRVGGAFLSLAIVVACIFACRCCTTKARRPVSNHAFVLATISHRDGQNYPMVYENGEWRPDRSGNPPSQNQPYQAGAPLTRPWVSPGMLSTPAYNPPPYPLVGEAAPPYSPPADNNPPPSYSVAVRGRRAIVDIRDPQEGPPPAAEGVHSHRDPHSQQQAGKEHSSRQTKL